MSNSLQLTCFSMGNGDTTASKWLSITALASSRETTLTWCSSMDGYEIDNWELSKPKFLVISQESDVHCVPHRDQLHHPQCGGLGRGSGETLEPNQNGWVADESSGRVKQLFSNVDIETLIFWSIGWFLYFQFHNGLCVLTQNIINEKIYLVLWFWYIFLGKHTEPWNCLSW